MDHILDSLLKEKMEFLIKNGAICLNHFEEKTFRKQRSSSRRKK